jgi:hypothetical protein
MSFNYAGAGQTAYDLFTRFGQTVTVRTKTTTDYDSDSGDVTEVEVSETATGVLLPGAEPREVTDQNPARTHDTALWILAATGLTNPPIPGSVIDGAGYSWAVIGLTVISPAGTPVVYRVTAKKMRVD